MKKLMSLLLAALMLLCFAACSNGSAGKETSSADNKNKQEENAEPETYYICCELEDIYSRIIELYDDGTGYICEITDNVESFDITWEQEGDSITITDNNASTEVFIQNKDGDLVSEESGAVYFMRTEDSADTPQENFTNKFGTPTTKCAHPGCNDYIAPSGDTNCCILHSNKCLNCGKYIDEDAMYCMDCLKKHFG